MDKHWLQRQFIDVALLRASRVIFNQQDSFKQLLLHPDKDTGSLLDLLLLKATQPSPLKAIFDRSELEVFT